MKNKNNAKGKKAVIKAQNKERLMAKKEVHEQKKHAREQEEQIKLLYDIVKEQKPELSEVRKSQVKAAGLKSAFYICPDKVLLTSFGKGNKAVLEKRIVRRGPEQYAIEKLNHALKVIPSDKNIQIVGRSGKQAIADNPNWTNEKNKKKPGSDLIFCKDKLEKKYFGSTFDDNIHIQIIHCIQDIDKIIAVHANDIVFALNNLLRNEGWDYDDLIGYLSLDKAYNKIREDDDIFPYIERIAWSSNRGYFGDILRPGQKRCKEENGERNTENEKHLEYCTLILGFMGSIRQATAHGDGRNRAKLYKPDAAENNSKGCWKEALELLDDLYGKRVDRLNNNFVKMSARDLRILEDIYNGELSKDELIRRFYRFVILKDYKTLGFSVKKLREMVAETEKEAEWIRDDSYSTVRRKLYRMIDFIIWQYYLKYPETAEEFVASLRASMNEIEKEVLYKKEASRLWKERALVDIERLKMKGTEIARINSQMSDQEEKAVFAAIEQISIRKENTHFFSKIIYLMTCFMDGKEINDLLTQLVNKFDNIGAFLEVLKAENLKMEFETEYHLFEESAQVSEELRRINSFARMAAPAPNVKRSMIKDAAEILGYSDPDLDEVLDNMMDPKYKPEGAEKKDNGFRNFIINNVVESRRFNYLVRYGNPKKIRKLAENRSLVSFVLNRIPDEQIRRYYNSCMGVKDNYYPKMREDLTNLITGITFKEFEGVHQNDRESGTTDQQRIDKERKKSLVNIYLTVVYILLKNLVYVNARYYMAFHCLERDCHALYGNDLEKTVKHTLGSYKDGGDMRVLAEKFLAEHPQKMRIQKYLEVNMENSDRWAIYTYRNQVAHMNPIRNSEMYISDLREINSYFELYHYLVQRTIIDQFNYEIEKGMIKEDELKKTKDYFESVRQYGTYCKDFVKALNIPFSYNLPRYKNLSINELFDRNNYQSKKAGRDL